jgi:hypothetical protein
LLIVIFNPKNITIVKKIKLLSLAGLVAVIALASCSKGSNGATGATGATGPAGPDSVLHSAWIALAMTLSVSSGDSTYTQNISASAITQNILDSGMVISYLEVIDNNGNSLVENAASILEVEYVVGAINVFGYGTYGDYSGYGFRYVIIPGTILTNSVLKGMSKAQIQNLSYDKLNAIVGTTGTVSGN